MGSVKNVHGVLILKYSTWTRSSVRDSNFKSQTRRINPILYLNILLLKLDICTKWMCIFYLLIVRLGLGGEGERGGALFVYLDTGLTLTKQSLFVASFSVNTVFYIQKTQCRQIPVLARRGTTRSTNFRNGWTRTSTPGREPVQQVESQYTR